jgi:hypothetical protein
MMRWKNEWALDGRRVTVYPCVYFSGRTKILGRNHANSMPGLRNRPEIKLISFVISQIAIIQIKLIVQKQN